MARCEPGRRKAYSVDLRWRMIWQREVIGLKLKEIAENLCVDVSTVCRINKFFCNTGSVSKQPYPVDRTPTKKLTDAVKILLLNMVTDEPHLYLRELQAKLLTFTGIDVSATNILKEMNFSRQKMKMVAKQRDEKLRSDFVEDVSVYKPHMLVFVDETGTDRRNSL